MRRLLFLSHCVPYPPDKGERTRAFYEIRELAKHFRVTVAALNRFQDINGSEDALSRHCEKVITTDTGGWKNMLRGMCSLSIGGSVTQGYFRSSALKQQLQLESENDPFDVVFAYSSSMVPTALSMCSAAHVTDLVDVDSAKWVRYAQRSHAPIRWMYQREARGVRNLEYRAVAQSDLVILCSRSEVEALGAESGNVLSVSNGVDCEYFSSNREHSTDQPPALVFSGTMDYKPNVDGITWFVQRVWPLLKERHPNLHLFIVGRNPTRSVRALSHSKDITVTGAVEDVRPYFLKSLVAIAPLHIARGIQNKVLEAMAANLPVVASTQAIEGLELLVNRDLLEAQCSKDWTDAIDRLLTDVSFRNTIAASGRRQVETHYSWSSRLAPLVTACSKIAQAAHHGSDSESTTPRALSA